MDFLLNTYTSVLSEMKGTSDSINLFLYQFPIFSNVNLFQASKFSPVFGSDSFYLNFFGNVKASCFYAKCPLPV